MTTSIKKIILACVLATSAASAMAEWTRVGETDAATFYLDYKTIRKDGNLRKVWAVVDLNQPHESGLMSRRHKNEYDCKAERWRSSSISGHSQNMTRGETLWNESSATSWQDIAPDTVSELILKIVCAK